MWMVLFIAAASTETPSDVQVAEAERLVHQMEQYADRQAWIAVEKGYLSAVATGAPLPVEAHRLGAHAARDRGNITEVEVRLQAALAVESKGEVIEELWAITQTYGHVSLHGTALVPEKVPFDPVQARALALVVQALHTAGAYKGLLPRGNYTLDGVDFHLLLGRPAVDLVTTKKKPKKR